MPTIQYQVLSSKNDGLPISPSELISQYFFGISLKNKEGASMSDSDIAFHIKAAVEEMEGYLNCKVMPQVITEQLDYNLSDFKSWGYIPTSYPVRCVHSLRGFLGKVEQVIYPKQWLSARSTSDGLQYFRQVFLIPTAGVSPDGQDTAIFNGVSPHLGWFGSKNIPNYWTISYVTSFDRIPEDIMKAIGKLAAIDIFHQLGDIILGAGIASQSLGIDSLSQSISTTSSATNAGYGARVTGYVDDLKRTLPILKSKYDGISLSSF